MSSWDPTELDACLTAKRMLEQINVLVEEGQFPPDDKVLQQDIKVIVADLLGATYPDKYEARCVRIFRAYGAAGRAVAAAANNRNGPWGDCKDELEHAQNGN